MPSLEGYRKIERINGVTYDMPPSAAAGHGIVNGNIFSIIKSGLDCRGMQRNDIGRADACLAARMLEHS